MLTHMGILGGHQAHKSSLRCIARTAKSKWLTVWLITTIACPPTVFADHAETHQRSESQLPSLSVENSVAISTLGKSCSQFDPKKNGNTVWSPYYWHVRAIGAHLVRDRLNKTTEPIFQKIRALVQGESKAVDELLASADRDPVETITEIQKLIEGSPEKAKLIEPLLKQLPAITKVGVIDAGMDTENPWLRGRFAPNIDPIDSVLDEVHAVHVAGIIGGRWPLGIGLYTQIHPYKIIAKEKDRDTGEAYEKANREVDLTNGSWGYCLEWAPNPTGLKKFQDALSNQSGAIHFMAAGNEGDTEISERAYGTSVIKVGSLTPTGDRSYFSCMGNRLCAMGFGHDIWSAHPTKGKELTKEEFVRYPLAKAGTGGIPLDLRRLSGTSMASPSFVGAVANWKSIRPSLNREEILELIKLTSISSPKKEPFLEGSGQINGYRGFRLVEKMNTIGGSPKDLNDFRAEAESEYQDGIQKLRGEKQTCGSLEQGLMALEKAYALDPSRTDIAKDLAVAFSSLGMNEDAIRIYGRVAKPEEFLSKNQFAAFEPSVTEAIQSKNPQVQAAGYKIKLRHSQNPDQQLEILKSSLTSPSVTRFLGEVIPSEVCSSVGSLNSKETLEFVDLLSNMPLSADSEVVQKLQSSCNKDPIVRHIITKVINQKTGKKMPTPVSIDELSSKLRDPKYREEFEELLMGDHPSGLYQMYAYNELFPKMNAQQRRAFLDAFGPGAGKFMGRLLKSHLVGLHYPDYEATLTAMGQTVPTEYLFKRDDDSETPVLNFSTIPFWFAHNPSLEEYLKLTSTRAADDFSKDDFAGATWKHVLENKDFREKGRNLVDNIVLAIDPAFTSASGKTDEEKCKSAVKEVGNRITGADVSYKDLFPLICPLMYHSKAEFDWVKSLSSHACFKPEALNHECTAGNNVSSPRNYELPPKIKDGDHLAALIEFNDNKIPEMLSRRGNIKPVLNLLALTENGRTALATKKDHDWDSPINKLLFPHGFASRRFSNAKSLVDFVRTLPPDSDPTASEYLRVLSAVDRYYASDVFESFRPYSQSEVVTESKKADEQYDSLLEMARQRLRATGKTFDNVEMVHRVARNAEIAAKKENTSVTWELSVQPSEATSITDWLMETALSAQSVKVKADALAHPDSYSKEVRDAIQKLPDYDAIKTDANKVETKEAQEKRFDKKMQDYLNWNQRFEVKDLTPRNVKAWEDWFDATLGDSLHWDKEFHDMVRTHFMNNLNAIKTPEEFASISPFLSRVLSKYVHEKRYGDISFDKDGGVKIDRTKESMPLFTPEQIPELSRIGDRFPLMYLLADMASVWFKDENKLPDLGKLSVADITAVFRWPVTEENHTRYARLLGHIEERIDTLQPAVREVFLKKYFAFSRTNLWR